MQISFAETSGSVPPASASSPAAAANPAPRQEPSRSVQAAVEVNNEKMHELIEEMQGHISSMNVNLRFSTYGEHKIAISVVNEDTGEVIREIPAKEIQALHAKMSELAGMIFNESA